jgi:hypothetical protein
MDYGVLCHFQQYFSYIVVVSFIGGENQSTQRKPQTCLQFSDKHYHIFVVLSARHHEQGSSSQL